MFSAMDSSTAWLPREVSSRGAIAEEHFERERLVGEELEVRAKACLDLAVRRGRVGDGLAERVAQASADVAQDLEVQLTLGTEVLVEHRLVTPAAVASAVIDVLWNPLVPKDSTATLSS